MSSAETVASLAALMRGFDRDPASRRRIAELLAAGPDAFREAAVEVLKTPEDTRAFQFLIAEVVSGGLLVPILCHPALPREQALAAARIAQRADPQVEAAIAKSLADGAIPGNGTMRPRDAARLLDLLDGISDGARILSSLLRLLRHPSPHLRSKAVKMIGRGSRSARWVQGRLGEPDSRVRANAIESLWGVDTSEARELLRTSVHDSDNRVAGNALVALYRVGDCDAIPGLYGMAAHELPRFRATAAWAMGETGDSRFLETLAHLLADEHQPVRARALGSLGRIKATVAKARQSEPWRVAGMVQDNPRINRRRLCLTLAAADGGPFPAALGTGFLVTEDGLPVVSYRAAERPSSEAMCVSFVFPSGDASRAQPWIEGALSCLPWKRRVDSWSLQPYAPPAGPEVSDRPAADPARATADLERIRHMFQQAPEPAQCAGFWNALLQAAMTDGAGAGGKRHVIVLANARISLPPPEELSPSVLGGVQFQAVSTVPNPLLEDFCLRVRGDFERVESRDDAAAVVRSFYLNLPTRHEIVYTPLSAVCRSVKVRIQGAGGWGEAAFPVGEETAARWSIGEHP